MKRIDHKFVPALPFPMSRMARPIMMRKGEQGGAAELLTREQQAHIDCAMREQLQRHRCDAPDDELFTTVDE